MPTGRIIYSGGPHVARGPQFAHPCTMRRYVTLVKRFSCLYWRSAATRSAGYVWTAPNNACNMVGRTGVKQVREAAGVRYEQRDGVVKGQWTDEVENEPRAHVVPSDLCRVENYLVSFVLSHNTCRVHHTRTHTVWSECIQVAAEMTASGRIAAAT